MTKEISVYKYSDYRSYLTDYLQARRAIERGVQSKLAIEIGCQAAYVSKVLAKAAHFSLEQAERVSHFCHQTEDETHFFMLLTQHTRAGTPTLKKYFALQLEKLKTKNKDLKDRMKLETVSDLETQLNYYRNWTIAAIHVLTTIPEFRTRQAIATKMNLSLTEVGSAVDFLKSKGMLEETAGGLRSGTVGLHLGADSPVIRQHHNNWRLKAMESIARGSTENLHYSSVVSVSLADQEKFRADLLRWIANFKDEVKVSKEETLSAICIDFFSLG